MEYRVSWRESAGWQAREFGDDFVAAWSFYERLCGAKDFLKREAGGHWYGLHPYDSGILNGSTGLSSLSAQRGEGG